MKGTLGDIFKGIQVKATFKLYSKAMLLWRDHWTISSPHQELQPWVGWFQPVSKRRPEWEVAWPSEDYLHP